MWYDDLCEYYGVTPGQALELSTRSSGRKPDLPGSRTCEPVSGKTWEELWYMKPRDTMAQKIAFYKDVGAWQSFRQCNFRKDFNYGYLYKKYCKIDASILEYGCGIAPMANWLAEKIGDEHRLKFTLVEVPSEHYEFAKWRLDKKAPKTSYNFIEITEDNLVPTFKTNFDFVCMMDVLEHLPNPYDVIKNIYNYLNKNATIIETWVHHEDGPGEADLEEAETEREITTKFLDEHFRIIEHQGEIRVRRKIKI